ncbi:MAG: alpha/beta hydrolase [Anaerolineaceae bacterium]|nr:alpha/beta hydrolase [Anaerolineaceae bacterium]
MPKIEVNDIHIYYELHGPEAADVLVLSNGIMMGTASWLYQTPVLSQHFRVLLYDCRGMWQSDHPAGPYSMEQHADDLAALLDALGIERAHIAGISYGSEVSMVFALQYPQKTKTLMLIDGVSEVSPYLYDQTLPWLLSAERGDAEMLLRTSVPLNYSQAYITANQVQLDAAVSRFAKLDMPALVELIKAFQKLNITAQLHQIQCPVLIVYGQEDLIKGQDPALVMAKEIKQAELVCVPGAGHALCLEKPNELNTILLGFAAKNKMVK